MDLFDSHCHLSDPCFDRDRDFIIGDFENFYIRGLVNPASDLESSKAALNLADRYPNIRATVGFHPEEVDKFKEEDFTELKAMLKDPKCLGIGEIGLDYYRKDDNKDKQKEVLIKQLDLAKEKKLPVVIHSRNAALDSLEILKAYPDLKIHFHCFDYDIAYLDELLTLKNLVISIGGAVTFKNKDNVKQAAGKVPLDRLLIETDSPYLTPVPFRGLRNDPRRLIEVARAIANLRGMKLGKLAKRTNENAKRFYNI